MLLSYLTSAHEGHPYPEDVLDAICLITSWLLIVVSVFECHWRRGRCHLELTAGCLGSQPDRYVTLVSREEFGGRRRISW